MTKRGIDMLPLLDVFMVVLFVFASIQEQQLDSSVHELDEAKAALAKAEAEAEAAIAKAEVEARATERLEAEAAARAEAEERQREQLLEYERECGPREPGGPACPAADPEAKTAAELTAVHERLLSNLAVFEVQLSGDADLSTGKLRTRCCFRDAPPRGVWRDCGEVPNEEHEREAWFEAGADGLIAGLSDTAGTSAVVLLNQGVSAKFMMSSDLADLLRERFPNHRVYDEGGIAGPSACDSPG